MHPFLACVMALSRPFHPAIQSIAKGAGARSAAGARMLARPQGDAPAPAGAIPGEAFQLLPLPWHFSRVGEFISDDMISLRADPICVRQRTAAGRPLRRAPGWTGAVIEK